MRVRLQGNGTGEQVAEQGGHQGLGTQPTNEPGLHRGQEDPAHHVEVLPGPLRERREEYPVLCPFFLLILSSMTMN